MEASDGHNFFIEKLKQDANFKTEMQTVIKGTSKEDIKQEIGRLRDDICNVLRPPKVYISVRDLEDLYSISESQQKGLRGRIKNPLPYHQDGHGGKIRYKVSEVEEWMSLQKVKRGV